MPIRYNPLSLFTITNVDHALILLLMEYYYPLLFSPLARGRKVDDTRIHGNDRNMHSLSPREGLERLPRSPALRDEEYEQKARPAGACSKAGHAQNDILNITQYPTKNPLSKPVLMNGSEVYATLYFYINGTFTHSIRYRIFLIH